MAILKDGTIETVGDAIEALKKCNPTDKISVRPLNRATACIVEEPDGTTYFDIKLEE